MTEKYKIYVPGELKMRMMADAEFFEFYKKDGSINLNAFLKTLLQNYAYQYIQSTSDQEKQFANAMHAKLGVDKYSAEEFAMEYTGFFRNLIREKENNHTAITLTVSGKLRETVELIENNFLKKQSLSEYIRNMVRTFMSMPRNRREQILFKDNCDLLNEAISGAFNVSVQTKNTGKRQWYIAPYCVSPSRDENCNYLLCYDYDKKVVRSFRVSRLKNIYVHSESYMLDDDIKSKLERMKKNPQFSFERTEEACVKLTDEGKRKYKMIYTNRPETMKIDGDYYYFEWPQKQLIEYFKKFGEDAVIVKPIQTKKAMETFYRSACIAYSES